MEGRTFLLILVVHFLADFVLQTHWQASNKSTNLRALMYHVLTYSLTWFAIVSIFTNNIEAGFMFFVVTFITHLTTDYITSKEVKRYFDNKDFHNGFVVIGFDQVLHYVQLYLTFKLASINFEILI